MVASALLAATLVVASCGSDSGGVQPSGSSQSDASSLLPIPALLTPALLTRITSDHVAPAADTVEVWVCEVPLDTTAARYGQLPLRQPLTPDAVVAAIGQRVARYFDAVSDGRYRLMLTAGGTIEMSATDDADDCVDAALDRSVPTADTVLAVATAEHVEGTPGGFGQPGSWPICDGSCPASVTRRAAYVGASDFHPDWGAVPLLDLIEHELGHTLGLPHSGSSEPGSDEYLSALDLMSDSAAPRAADAERRDAPALIGVARVDLGWLDLDDVAVVTASSLDDAGQQVVVLSPSTSSAGTRLLVVPVVPSDDHRMLTIEYLVPDGFNDHLPEAGVAVHLIDDRAGEGLLRVQQTIGTPPFTDLLSVGEELEVGGWSIVVDQLSVGSEPQVTVRVGMGRVGMGPVG